MKIYISGTFTSQKRLRPWRDELWHLGHEVVGSWLDEVAKPDGMPLPVWNKKLAIKDVAEVKQADMFILDLEGESTTGGRFTEFGYALATHKLIYVIASNPPKTGIFLALADGIFPSWDALMEHIKREHAVE